jgi:nucleoside 2-deoxyribosyltransferase
MKKTNMPNSKLKIYLASPYGFTDAGREFMKDTMIPYIQGNRFEILNPWEALSKTSRRFQKINSLNDIGKQKKLFKALNRELAAASKKMLEQSEVMVAIIDGSDADSGVASEIGYAYALGKKIIGYRSDFRLSGDNLGAIINIQVEYFIYESGGQIVTNISELKQTLQDLEIAYKPNRLSKLSHNKRYSYK